MSSPVPEWRPSFFESFKLAWKPIAIYGAFTFFGFAAFFLSIVAYDHGSKAFEVFAAVTAGFAGVLCGQLVALLRFRTIPVLIVGSFSVFVAVMVGIYANANLPSFLGIAIFFFCFAFPSGMLSLHHRFELLGVFWPAIGWIGSVMIILNEEGRASTWEKSKVGAWLPIPLILLALFLLGLLLFMASKQAMRVSNWQALSGATERRVKMRAENQISAIPKKNLLPILIATALLFAFTAVISPYLWRTGKGDRDGKNGAKGDDTGQVDENKPGPKPPDIDGEAIAKAMQSAASSAAAAAHTLWPLLLFALFYRPIKRAALTSHLKTPIFPTPPSERIDNLWEYVRIAAQDAGAVCASSDSVDDFVRRAKEKGTSSPELEEAARIYERTRYGFVVARGDGLAMKRVSVPAARVLRKEMTTWDTVKSFFRPLS